MNREYVRECPSYKLFCDRASIEVTRELLQFIEDYNIAMIPSIAR